MALGPSSVVELRQEADKAMSQNNESYGGYYCRYSGHAACLAPVQRSPWPTGAIHTKKQPSNTLIPNPWNLEVLRICCSQSTSHTMHRMACSHGCSPKEGKKKKSPSAQHYWTPEAAPWDISASVMIVWLISGTLVTTLHSLFFF